MHFPAKLTPNGVGGFIVRFTDLEEALSEGTSRDEALDNAADALEVALLGAMKDGVEIPVASRSRPGEVIVAVPAQAAAKLAFYEAFRSSGLSRSALARKLGKDEAEIRRMLDPYHATKLPALDEAVRALGRTLTIDLAPT